MISSPQSPPSRSPRLAKWLNALAILGLGVLLSVVVMTCLLGDELHHPTRKVAVGRDAITLDGLPVTRTGLGDLLSTVPWPERRYLKVELCVSPGAEYIDFLRAVDGVATGGIGEFKVSLSSAPRQKARVFLPGSREDFSFFRDYHGPLDPGDYRDEIWRDDRNPTRDFAWVRVTDRIIFSGSSYATAQQMVAGLSGLLAPRFTVFSSEDTQLPLLVSALCEIQEMSDAAVFLQAN